MEFNQYQSLFLALLSIKVFIGLFLSVRNRLYVSKNSAQVPDEFKDKITLEDHKKAASYTSAKAKISEIETVFDFGLLLVWLPGGLLNSLDTWTSGKLNIFSSATLNDGLALFAAFSLINGVLDLPFKIFQTFSIEQKFGFNKMTPKLFIVDLIKHTIIGSIMGGGLLALILWIFESAGQSWWWLAWITLISFQFIMMWGYPKFIAPLFNKFGPLEDESLKSQIEALLKKCGFESQGVFVMDASKRSSHGNAYFTGFGKNKRIVFFDNLIKSLTGSEIEAVLAHELGHFKKKHILKMLIGMTAFSFIIFWILGQVAYNPSFYQTHFVSRQSPYMTLMLFSLVLPAYTFWITPVFARFSRKNEFEADEFAAQNSSNLDLISALVKLYKENASTLTPDPLYSSYYHSHPPALERIEFLKSLSS